MAALEYKWGTIIDNATEGQFGIQPEERRICKIYLRMSKLTYLA